MDLFLQICQYDIHFDRISRIKLIYSEYRVFQKYSQVCTLK